VIENGMCCCSITAKTVEAALKEIEEACGLGADAVELRLDFLQDLDVKDPGPTLRALLAKCKELDRPAIVTFRPEWEGYAALPALSLPF
jgi:3-dehydroquinate dehydratase type I